MTLADSRKPYIIAHRGASSRAPDNSIEAFGLAIDLGADMIEFDVRRTGDDQLIAFHNPTIGERPISDFSRDEIADRAGFAPPLFSEVLALTRGRIKLDIELKEHGYVPRVLNELTSQSVAHGDIVVTSFVDQVIEEIKRSAPDIECGLLLGVGDPRHVVRTRLSELFPVSRVRRCGADFVAPYTKLARLGVLARAHAAGYSAYVWTVNDPKQLEHFLGDPRVAAVITDDATLALELRNGSSAVVGGR